MKLNKPFNATPYTPLGNQTELSVIQLTGQTQRNDYNKS